MEQQSPLPRDLPALSIRQPWASLVVSGIKRIENRSRRVRYRGPVLIHAAGKLAPVSKAEIEQRLQRALDLPPSNVLPRSGVIGIAHIVGCVETSDDPLFCGPYGWQLEDARPLPFIRMRGKLGLFRVAADVIEQLASALALAA